MPESRSARLDSLDLLRGVIMVVMSLDHIRDYFTNFPVAPEDVFHTWPALFFTRWITHFCAPVFFFLAGTGAYLSKSGDRAQFLWKRGLWLVALELTVIGFGWTFTTWTYAGVIWALGWCMVLMALLVRLPAGWVGAFGLALIFGHNLLDRVQVKDFHGWGWLWMFLHQPGFIPIVPAKGIFLVLYVLIPWVGVMAAGYAFGEIIRMDGPRRRNWLLSIGGCATLLFAALRYTNLYGQPSDPHVAFASAPVFEPQPTFIMTVVAFLDVQKYPPALQYLLMTLGPAILFLRFFDGLDATRNAVARFFVLFGRVPMFYYILHIYLIHALAYGLAAATGQPSTWLLHGGFMNQRIPDGYGRGLAVVYLVWFGVNLALYFPCRWYAEYKRTHSQWWLRYL